MFTPEVLIGLRWIHFVAGITWIGLLYWFSLVNVPYQRVLDPSIMAKANLPLFIRAAAWARWSALVTVLAGLLMIYGLYWQDGGLFDNDTEITIFAGATIGIVLLAIVWFAIWPNQRRVLEALKAGQPPNPAWPRNALYASRVAFALSFPLLFFMAGSSHYPLDWTGVFVVGTGLALLGAAIVLIVQKYWATRF